MFGRLKKKTSKLVAPATGKVIAIEEVKDPVFSDKMMGDGFGIETKETLHAPVTGEVLSIFPTKHAVTFREENGTEVLMHIGLDTVELKGQGFDILVEEGQKVTPETAVAKVDFDFLADQGKDTTVIVVATNLADKKLKVTTGETTQGAEVAVVS